MKSDPGSPSISVSCSNDRKVLVRKDADNYCFIFRKRTEFRSDHIPQRHQPLEEIVLELQVGKVKMTNAVLNAPQFVTKFIVEKSRVS